MATNDRKPTSSRGLDHQDLPLRQRRLTSRSAEEYQVGWICALPKELTAARAMLDEEHDAWQGRVPQDPNSYVLGRIYGHNIAMACLPTGRYGTTSAASVATHMLRTFTSIRFCLLVGIGAGIPNLDRGWDIRLGDIVVSHPEKTHGGVVQYNARKNMGGGVYELNGCLQPPPTFLLTALASLRSQHDLHGNQITSNLTHMILQNPMLAGTGYISPGEDKDLLYCSHVQEHGKGRSCYECEQGYVVRQPRNAEGPVIHYGTIASGDDLLKDVQERDRLGRVLGAKCVEMEAAGVMNNLPCLVVRGICDYADSYKNDVWQEYAAATAAAFGKELLQVVQPTEVNRVKAMAETTDRSKSFDLGVNLLNAPVIDRALFVGRETEIQAMEQIVQAQLEATSPYREVLVLGGPGGMGKTQLAISFAHHCRGKYDSIFWLNATSEITLQDSLQRMAECIFRDSDDHSPSGEQNLERIKQWFSDRSNTRWLLIFDNYDDPASFDLRNYYPQTSHGTILVTSRQPNQVDGQQVPLRPMQNLGEGLSILEKRSGRRDTSRDQGAKKLVERLEGLPLALATAGKFLQGSSMTYEEYLGAYENQRILIAKERLQLREYSDRTLFTTWDISYAQVERKDPDASKMLKLLAYFGNQGLTFNLFHAGLQDDQPEWLHNVLKSPLDFDNTLQILVDYCFVEVQAESQTYSMHRCMHDWLSLGLDKSIDSQSYWYAFSCVAKSIDKELGDGDERTLAHIQYTRMVPHAIRLTSNRFDRFGREISEVHFEQADTFAKLLRYQSQFNSAKSLLDNLLVRQEELCGPDSLVTLYTVAELGVLAHEQGDLSEAETLYLRALAGFEKDLGPEHPSTLNTVSNLGLVYDQQGKLDEAERLYLRALAGYVKVLGPEHPSTLSTVDNLGLVYRQQGKLDKAERLSLRALAGKEKVLRPEHTSTLETVNNLGIVYWQQGKLDEAERLYLRALAGKEKVLGPEHISTLDTVYNLGLLYRDQGRLAQAEQMFRRTVDGRRKNLGVDHPKTRVAETDLDEVMRKQAAEQSRRVGKTALVGETETTKRVTTAETSLLQPPSSPLKKRDRLKRFFS